MDRLIYKHLYKPNENVLQMNQSASVSHLSDVLPHVLDHHFISSDGLQGKQTPVVDMRFAEPDLLLTELKREKGHRVLLLITRKAAINAFLRKQSFQ